MSVCTVEQCADVIECKTDIKNLNGWQKSQNGAIHRVEDNVGRLEEKVDKIILAVLGLLATALMSAVGTVMLLLRSGH